jgi:hypothetical protein
VTAVFAEVFHYQPHVFQMAHARLRVPEPKALRMLAHKGGSALTQLWRCRCGRRPFAQFIVVGCHETKLKTMRLRGKE